MQRRPSDDSSSGSTNAVVGGYWSTITSTVKCGCFPPPVHSPSIALSFCYRFTNGSRLVILCFFFLSLRAFRRKQKSNGASVLTVAVGASVLTVVRAWRYASYAQLATASDHLDGRARYNIPAVPRPVEALLPSSGSACWGKTRELGARRYHQSWATPDPPSPFPLCYPVSRKS